MVNDRVPKIQPGASADIQEDVTCLPVSPTAGSIFGRRFDPSIEVSSSLGHTTSTSPCNPCDTFAASRPQSRCHGGVAAEGGGGGSDTARPMSSPSGEDAGKCEVLHGARPVCALRNDAATCFILLPECHMLPHPFVREVLHLALHAACTRPHDDDVSSVLITRRLLSRASCRVFRYRICCAASTTCGISRPQLWAP